MLPNSIPVSPHCSARKGVDIAPAAQLGKPYAKAVAPLLDQFQVEARNAPRHSNAVVVIDKEGSIAAITHTINSVIWGDTGIVVGGIPIPDSAGFQQTLLATIKPGDRVPNEMVQTIVFTGGKPTMATAAIGSSGMLETVKLVLAVAGQGLDLATVQAAPPPLYNFMLARPGQSAMTRGLAIPDGAYPVEFVKNLEALNVKVTKIPAATANGLRGTVVAVKIDPDTGEKTDRRNAGRADLWRSRMTVLFSLRRCSNASKFLSELRQADRGARSTRWSRE